MDYAVNLDAFQGPLDLLLMLIKQNQVDIYDIPIALITEQYLESMQDVVELDLELMADFMVMAATLISIKSRMLLPRSVSSPISDEGDEDPREELVRQLVEYQRCKDSAGHLEARLQSAEPRVYYREDPNIEPDFELKVSLRQLARVFQTLWMEYQRDEPQVEIPQGDISIHEKMKQIADFIGRGSGRRFLHQIFDLAASRREALVLFLALLELIKQGRVWAAQAEPFSPIQIGGTGSRRHVV